MPDRSIVFKFQHLWNADAPMLLALGNLSSFKDKQSLNMLVVIVSKLEKLVSFKLTQYENSKPRHDTSFGMIAKVNETLDMKVQPHPPQIAVSCGNDIDSRLTSPLNTAVAFEILLSLGAMNVLRLYMQFTEYAQAMSSSSGSSNDVSSQQSYHSVVIDERVFSFMLSRFLHQNTCPRLQNVDDLELMLLMCSKQLVKSRPWTFEENFTVCSPKLWYSCLSESSGELEL